jgi:hypothetical protein
MLHSGLVALLASGSLCLAVGTLLISRLVALLAILVVLAAFLLDFLLHGSYGLGID